MVGDCLGLGDHEVVEFGTFAVMTKMEFRDQSRIDLLN